MPTVPLPLLFAAAAACLLSADAAIAHHSGTFAYPPACCHGDEKTGECQPIPETSVREGPAGFAVVLMPGEHPRVTRRQSFLIPYGNAMRSGDGRFHICLHPSQTDVNCFFAPPGSA